MKKITKEIKWPKWTKDYEDVAFYSRLLGRRKKAIYTSSRAIQNKAKAFMTGQNTITRKTTRMKTTRSTI